MRAISKMASLLFFLSVVCVPAVAVSKQEKGDEGRQVGKTQDELERSSKKKVEVRQDRIKSVQRKVFLKRHRWEMAPAVILSLNDAFYQKMGGGAQLSFYPADSLGLGLQAMYVGTVQTDMVGYYQQANQALPKVSNIRFWILGDLMWSPLYGKLSFVTDEIIHFDAYLIAGFGMVYTETGAKFATNFGIGLRYFLSSWLVFKLEVRDLLYTETFQMDVQRTEFSDIQNHVMLSAAVSFFLPADFDYEYQ